MINLDNWLLKPPNPQFNYQLNILKWNSNVKYFDAINAQKDIYKYI